MEANRDAIIATLGVFSGRPNPEVSLVGEVAEEFVNLVKQTIGREPIHPPPPPKLWHYNGFLVQTPNELASRLELPARFSVHHGVLTEGRGREKKHWRDVANIERFLINQAYEQGHGDLLEEFGVDKAVE
jgi:hypothetical protein